MSSQPEDDFGGNISTPTTPNAVTLQFNILLEILLGSSNNSTTNAYVLFLPKRRSFVSFLFDLIYCLILGFFVLAFLIEIVDIARYVVNNQGSANSILELISLAYTPLIRIIACCSCVFLRKNSPKLKQCAQMLQQHLDTYVGNKTKSIVRRQQVAKTSYSLVALFACAISFVTVFFRKNSGDLDLKQSTILFMSVPPQTQGILTSTTTFASAFFVVYVTAIFTYYVRLLLCCVQSLNSETSKLLTNEQKINGWAGHNDPHVQSLRNLRIQHEDLIEVFDKLQKTFGFKLLLDFSNLVIALLSMVADFTTVPANTEADYLLLCVNNIAIVCLQMLTLWMIAQPSLAVRQTNIKTAELLEKTIFQRQISKGDEITIEEVDISTAFLHRLTHTTLTFSAAGVLECSQQVLTAVLFAVIGFLCFAIDRMENVNKEVTIASIIVNSILNPTSTTINKTTTNSTTEYFS